jgi:hypothetical protein
VIGKAAKKADLNPATVFSRLNEFVKKSNKVVEGYHLAKKGKKD